MQKMNEEESEKRYACIVNAIKKLFYSNDIEEFIYNGTNGYYQTNTFKNIMKHLLVWISNKENYTNRFNKKKLKFQL